MYGTIIIISATVWSAYYLLNLYLIVVGLEINRMK